MLRPSKGILATIPPPIPQAYQWATAYQATPERPLLDMSQGVPRNPPELELQKAITDATSAGAWGYCPAEGELSLRESLFYSTDDPNAGRYHARRRGHYSWMQYGVRCCSYGLADHGDEVILPLNATYRMTLTLLGIKPRSFLPSPQKCKALITSKTKAIALVTPNNPVNGAIYSPCLLAEFSLLAKEAGIALIIDETYRDFIILDCLQICAPRDMAAQLQHRHAVFRRHLPVEWKTGIYAFVRHPFEGRTSVEVAKRLAVEMGGTQKWVRFSVANVDDEKVIAVCRRLKEAESVFAWKLDV
ncbi:PLP-dependent transferase [Hymenopellis radicata]|nr:PLP-dependent transferase [Hymenopellis radicata]